MVATIKLGFVKDAHHHIDIQGFNVYHKNRLIKVTYNSQLTQSYSFFVGYNRVYIWFLHQPFWRVWNAAGSDGRGVIGILEANFIQPAHNKQGFERTVVLAKLESRLIHHQKHYWYYYTFSTIIDLSDYFWGFGLSLKLCFNFDRSSRCHEIGYAPRRKQKNYESSVKETTRTFYNTNLDRGSVPTAAPARSRQNVELSGRNQNSQVNK